MDNKKKKIVGVAVISGVILVSVASVGTVQLIRENNAQVANKFVTAQASDLNAGTSYTDEKTGFSYILETINGENVATLVSISPDTGMLSGVYGPGSKNGIFYINIRQTVTKGSTSYTVRTIGDGTNSILDTTKFKNLFSDGSNNTLMIIIPKSVTKLSTKAISGHSYIPNLRVINLSNNTTYASNCITKQTDSYVHVYGIPTSETSSLGDEFTSLYDTSVDSSSKTVSITGFKGEFSGIPDEARINIKFPEYLTVNGTKYPVTKISANAFSNDQKLKDIIIPTTVTKIETGSFAGCDYLGLVKFLNKKTEIAADAFFDAGISKMYGLSGSTAETYYKNKQAGVSSNTKWTTLTVKNLEVATNPNKIAYKVGESLDKTGLVLKVTYSDGYSDGNWGYIVDTSQITCTPSKFTTAISITPVTATYEGKSVTFPVSVTASEVAVTDITFSCDDSRFNAATGSSVANLTLKVGEKAKLNAKITPDNATNTTLTWKSLNDNIATVDNQGNITAKSAGTITITATAANGISKVCSVIIEPNDVEVTGVKIKSDHKNFISPTNEAVTYLTLDVGEKAKLTAEITPDNATNKTITWKVDEGFTDIATIDSSGNLTAKKSGTVWIYAKASNGKQGLCKLTVLNPEVKVESIIFGDPAKTLKVGETTEISYSVSPSTATNKDVEWSSSDASVASVDNTGKITANKAGTAKITAKAKDGSGVTATCEITVEATEVKVTKINLSEENKTLKIGEKFTLEAKVEPDTATNKQVEWKSEDESIATVSSSGEVAAVKEGSTNIVATAKDGSGTKAICKVNVEKQDTTVRVESITLEKKTAELQVGGKLSLKATINPDNATNKKISWDSSNTAVATVEDGLVTAKSEGKATITVKTEDGGKTDTAEITVVKEIVTDTTGPTINSVKGEKDSEGIYRVIIKATDESGIGKVIVYSDSNPKEITNKDEDGNYYFKPSKNGKYVIEVYDTKGNVTPYTYTENSIVMKTSAIPSKDSSGNYIVYIEPATYKKVKTVKVNDDEIKNKDDQGRYYFKPSGNRIYKFSIEYEDGTTDNVEYTENRFTNNNTGDPSNGNGNGNNGGTTTTGGSKITGTGNSGSSSTGGTGSIKTSTALTNLPKTGTKMGAFFATIASGIAAVFAWFRQRKEK